MLTIPSAFYQLQKRFRMFNTKQLRSEMLQDLREDGIPIDPWLYAMVEVEKWSNRQPFSWVPKVSSKNVPFLNASISKWRKIRVHFCTQIRFFGVMCKTPNISHLTKHSILLSMRCESPRTFSSAPRLDLDTLIFVGRSCHDDSEVAITALR